MRRGKIRADYILIIWLLLLVLQMIVFYTLFQGVLYNYPKLLVTLMPLPVLHGVLVYFYTLEITGRTKLQLKTILLHLIPFFLLSILTIPFMILPEEEQYRVVTLDFSSFLWYMYLKLAIFVISGFSYATASILEVRRYRKRIKEYLSNTDQVQLRWLEFLNIGLGGIWFLVFFTDDTIISTGVIIFIVGMAFFSINRLPLLYSNQAIELGPDFNAHASGEEKNAGKYAKSGMDDDALKDIIRKVDQVMMSEKVFKNPELTLQDLSEKTDTPTHQLSQAINTHHGKSFYNYVNNLRVSEFLEMSKSPESKNYTYLALAFDSGFNSKTTFNKYFKLTTGQTPSQNFSTD